jgi:hypothetical protein
MFDFKCLVESHWSDLGYFDIETQNGFAALSTISTNQERSATEIQDKFYDTVKKDPKMSHDDPEFRGTYYSAHYESAEKVLQEILRQQRYSLCLSTFSFVEGRLKSICERIESCFHFKVKISDLNSRQHLWQYWNYLVKVVEIREERSKPHFENLDRQKIIRNKIAHQGGFLSGSDERQVHLVQGLRLIKNAERMRIEIVGDSYFKYLNDVAKSLFDELNYSINERCRYLTAIQGTVK